MNPFFNRFSFYWKVLKNSVASFAGKDTLTQSAAISYYMVFSLPPMLLIVFWIAGLWYQETLVRETVFEEIGAIIGQQGADQIMQTLETISGSRPTVKAAIFGIGVLLFTASTVFVSMKNALNNIFEVTIDRSLEQGIIRMLLDRFLSIAMLCLIGTIITVSQVLSAIVTAFTENIENWVGDSKSWVLLFDNIVLNLLALTLVFALTYRYMPDTRLKWKGIWTGALTTAVLFLAGESVIETFIGKSQFANYYEAAGGILVFMLWVYYTSAIFLFGATITHFRTKLE